MEIVKKIIVPTGEIYTAKGEKGMPGTVCELEDCVAHITEEERGC